jgi:hypothetical protein
VRLLQFPGMTPALLALQQQRDKAFAHASALAKQPGATQQEIAAARRRCDMATDALIAATPLEGEAMDDERAPKRGHSSPAGGKAAATEPSTPTRTAGSAPGASGTPPPNQPKRPRNQAGPSALPPSIIDGEEQALREASETLAAKAGDGPPARRA